MPLSPELAELQGLILQSVEQEEQDLPVLPEIAIKIRDMVDDPNVSAEAIVRLISNDPAMAAQILKVANSAAFFGKSQVENVRDAISRIGFRMLRNVILAISVSNLFKSANAFLNTRLNQVWQRSQQVAALCLVIAARQPYLRPEQAMLAGLLHNIGILPICQYLDRKHISLPADTFEELARMTHPRIGALLLRRWNFPHDLVDSASGHEDIHRNSGSTALADYTDCVLVAVLMARGVGKITAWDNISAATRLGFTVEECQLFRERFENEIQAAEQLLGLDKAPKKTPQRGNAPAAATATSRAQPGATPRPLQPAAPREESRKGLLSLITRLFN